MTFILEGVDPTKFNFWASVFAEVMVLTTAYVLSEVFRLLLSLDIRRGKKIPIAGLGRLPAGLIDAIEVAVDMKYSSSSLFITLLFLSDYATTIAFAGLGFEYVENQGPQAPVWSLQKRNAAVPYEALGDPVNRKTLSMLEVLLKSGNTNSNHEEIFKLAQQENIVSSFLGAADAIARGESVFLTQSEAVKNDPTFLIIGQQGSDSLLADSDSVVLLAEDSFLSAINLTIPLTCHDGVNSFTEIEEVRGENLDFHTTSHVADCTFTSPRDSGIFGMNKKNQPIAEVTAHVSTKTAADLYFTGQPDRLVRGYVEKDMENWADDFLWGQFQFPPNGFPLARYRTDFRKGRQVFGFGGLKYGAIDIPFRIALVASGRPLFGVETKTFSQQLKRESEERMEYHLIAGVEDGKCPEDPSHTSGTDCFVIVSLDCEVFDSDKGLIAALSNEKSCTINEIQIVWGKNFVIDSELLALVAGVYGRNAVWANSIRRKRILALNSIPSALFMLGSLDSREAIVSEKSTTINGVFLGFIFLPIVIGLLGGTVFFLGRKYLEDIPDNGMKMFMLNGEYSKRSTRSSLMKVGNRVSAVNDSIPTFQPRRSSTRLGMNSDLSSNLHNGPSQSHRSMLASEESDDLSDRPEESTDNSGSSSPENVEEHVGKSNGTADELEKGIICNVDATRVDRDKDGSGSNIGDQVEEVQMGMIGGKSNETEDELETGILCNIDATSIDSNKDGSGSNIVPIEANFGDELEEVEMKKVGNENFVFSNDAMRPSDNSKSVLFCMFFSVIMGIAAIIMIRTKAPNTGTSLDTSIFPSKEADFYPSKNAVPSACFVNNFELGTAVGKYLDGTRAHRMQVEETYGKMENWCVEHVEDFSYLFTSRKDFDVNISGWNVGKGQSFSHMFAQADAFGGNLSSWNVSNSKDFSYMFYRANDFQGSVSGWDVSNGIDFTGMFASTQFFNDDLSRWDVSRGTDFTAMFQSAEVFNGDVSKWDVSSGISFWGMFMGTWEFDGNLSAWDVSSGIYFTEMFASATSFKVGNLSSWDVSKGTSFARMFSSVWDSFDADLSGWRTSSGVDFSYMFLGCSLASVGATLSNWDVSSGEDFSYMFADLFGGSYGLNNANLSNWNVSSGTDFSFMFMKRAGFDSDLSRWDVSRGTDFQMMFAGASAFNCDLSMWDVSRSNDFFGMFQFASAFNSDLSGWNVSNVKDFSGMFIVTDSFNADISGWDISNGVNFEGMFIGATNFSQNLCPWISKQSIGLFQSKMELANQMGMLENSGCPVQHVSEFAFCEWCVEQPSAAPTETMEPSAAPKTSTAHTCTLCPDGSNPGRPDIPTTMSTPNGDPMTCAQVDQTYFRETETEAECAIKWEALAAESLGYDLAGACGCKNIHPIGNCQMCGADVVISDHADVVIPNFGFTCSQGLEIAPYITDFLCVDFSFAAAFSCCSTVLTTAPVNELPGPSFSPTAVVIPI